MFKKLFFFLSLPFLLLASVPTIVQNSDLMTYVEKTLPHEGLLKQTQEGFLYVELPKDYVFSLLPFLPQVCPPPYFEKDKIGAHITVATASEMAELKCPKVSFLGEKVSFSIESLAKVSLETSKIGSEVYMLQIHSSKIFEIRKELGLSPKIRDMEFHITIAVNCK